MQQVHKAIQANGAEIIAISSEDKAKTRNIVDRTKAQYPVLSDVKQQAIGAYNATDAFNPRIARPQIYIIDESGTIRWKFLDIRVGNRFDSAEIIDELKKL